MNFQPLAGPIDVAYRAGLDTYFAGDDDEALAQFAAVLDIAPSHQQKHGGRRRTRRTRPGGRSRNPGAGAPQPAAGPGSPRPAAGPGSGAPPPPALGDRPALGPDSREEAGATAVDTSRSYCAACGRPRAADDRFCPGCGTPQA